MNESWLDRNQKKIFYGMLGVLLLICIIAFLDVRVFAATQNNNLPYLVDSLNGWTNVDGYSISELEEFYNNRWGVYYPLNWNGNVFVYEHVENMGIWGDYTFTSVFVPQDNNSSYYFDFSDSYEHFDITSDYATFHGNNYGVVTFSSYRNQYTDPGFSGIGNQNVRLFFQGQIPLAANGNFYDNRFQAGLIEIGTDVVFGPWQPAIPDIGHSTQPNNDPDNFINGIGDNNPIARPQRPTPNPFTPSVWNPPTPDLSTLEKTTQSIYDFLVYGFNYLNDNISGWFSNLLNNLQAWVIYIVESIEYAINKVISAIHDVATFLYNNFVSLFEAFFELCHSVFEKLVEFLDGFKEKQEYASEPLDYDRLDAYWQTTTIYQVEDTIGTFTDELSDTFTNVVPPQRLVFSVDFSNGPWPFSECGRMEFNFDFYEGIRHTIVPWILAFLYVGVSLALLQQIPNIIRGVAGMGWSTQQGHVEHMSNAEWFGMHWTHSFDASGYIGGGGGLPSTYRNVNGMYGNWKEI